MFNRILFRYLPQFWSRCCFKCIAHSLKSKLRTVFRSCLNLISLTKSRLFTKLRSYINLKSHYKYGISYLHLRLSLKSGLCCKNNRRNGICYHKISRKGSTHRYNKGGILIEFAFSIPILIILLFFASDHYRLFELQDKLKASAYLAASMLQQIRNTKSDKQLTQNDLARIAYASCLNLFHTNSMFKPWPLGMYFAIDFWWVKRISENNYRLQTGWGTTASGNSPNGMTKNIGDRNAQTFEGVKGIHPDMLCDKDGEEKLMIDCSYRKVNFNKSKLGFFIITPQSSYASNYLFRYTLVITPKPGLFPGKYE